MPARQLLDETTFVRTFRIGTVVRFRPIGHDVEISALLTLLWAGRDTLPL